MGLVALRAMLVGRDRPGEVLADTAPGLSDDNRDTEYQSKKTTGWGCGRVAVAGNADVLVRVLSSH